MTQWGFDDAVVAATAPGRVFAMDIHASGGRLVVASGSDDRFRLFEVDVATGEVSREVGVDAAIAFAGGVRYAEDDLIVAGRGLGQSHGLWRCPARGDSPTSIATLADTGLPEGLEVGGGFAIVAAGSHAITVDLRTGSIVRRIEGRPELAPVRVAKDASAANVWLGGLRPAELVLMDVASGDEVDTCPTPRPEPIGHVAVSADGDRVMVSNDGPKGVVIYSLRAQAPLREKTFNAERSRKIGAFTPDGECFVVAGSFFTLLRLDEEFGRERIRVDDDFVSAFASSTTNGVYAAAYRDRIRIVRVKPEDAAEE